MSLGEKLIELRKQKNLSQEEVAEKLNVTRQTISKWETDSSTPDFDKIVPICELYNITTNELLRGKKEENKIVDETDAEEKKKKRVLGIMIGVFSYFIAVAWMLIGISVIKINPIICSAVFILICGVATCIIIYTKIMTEKEKTEEEKRQEKLYKQIDDITGLFTFIIYLIISLTTHAWHITWFIFLIYALVMEIIKLIMMLRRINNEK